MGVGPRELQGARVSSPWRTVPLARTAPTVMAKGELPGEVTLPSTVLPSAVSPRLPAEATTTMPARTARSTAWSSGSSRYDCVTCVPSDMLITRMLCSARCSMAQSTASITSATWPEPSSPSTRRLIRCAPGAIPPAAFTRRVPISVPATIPARCVP